MKRSCWIVLLFLLVLTACDATTREARRMVKRAEQLADTLPDSTVRLIDSVLRMPASFSERERMDMALLQAEALFGDHGQEISPIMDDDFFDDRANLSTSPELEHAGAYYANKKDYTKAAHAALYSGFVQQHYDEKEAAMRSFKEAERYGEFAKDSLTMARAEYRMGEMLYDEGKEQEAMELFKAANKGFGDCSIDCAKAQNSMACCYMLIGENDSAEMCLDHGLVYADRGHSNKTRRKVMNNYAVLCQLQGKYERSIHFLKQLEVEPDSSRLPLLYLNLGDTYINYGKPDSAAFYYNQLEDLLPNVKVNDETKASVYNALSRFAKSQGSDSLALSYREKHETLQYEVMQLRNDQSVYRIQQQYNYESLQNTMNQKIFLRHRIILVISVVAILGLMAFAISRIKLAQTQKAEAEANANLFHFMQQNKELAQKNEIQKQNQINLSQKFQENELAYRDLLEKLNMQAKLANEYGEAFSQSLKKEQAVMLRLHLFMENKGDEELLAMLEKTVFGKQEHWEAIMEAVDQLYPNLRKVVSQEELGLDELEQKDVILSYIGVSRHDESLLLHKSTDMVDKIRNRSRKKIKSISTGIKLP